MYEIEYAKGVESDLRALKPYYRNQLMDAIDEQLAYEPALETRNRKRPMCRMEGLVPPWDHVAPVWELRVGEHRVYYDVDVDNGVVIVRAVRRKPPHSTTEETL